MCFLNNHSLTDEKITLILKDYFSKVKLENEVETFVYINKSHMTPQGILSKLKYSKCSNEDQDIINKYLTKHLHSSKYFFLHDIYEGMWENIREYVDGDDEFQEEATKYVLYELGIDESDEENFLEARDEYIQEHILFYYFSWTFNLYIIKCIESYYDYMESRLEDEVDWLKSQVKNNVSIRLEKPELTYWGTYDGGYALKVYLYTDWVNDDYYVDIYLDDKLNFLYWGKYNDEEIVRFFNEKLLELRKESNEKYLAVCK